ncbi:hypothetical protein NL108_011743 [Boleophthalmus pectinirostris]|nr:hypothetical protein NL108_011743 [Boleophthalmus pectinirostris]
MENSVHFFFYKVTSNSKMTTFPNHTQYIHQQPYFIFNSLLSSSFIKTFYLQTQTWFHKIKLQYIRFEKAHLKTTLMPCSNDFYIYIQKNGLTVAQWFEH